MQWLYDLFNPWVFISSASLKHIGGEIFHRVGKARAGRLLDGIEHNAMPEVM